MPTNQNNESLQWTWKDTLERIQYIDTIISQIVSGGLVFDTILFGVFGALIALNSKDSSFINEGMVWILLTVLSIAGIVINFLL